MWITLVSIVSKISINDYLNFEFKVKEIYLKLYKSILVYVSLLLAYIYTLIYTILLVLLLIYNIYRVFQLQINKLLLENQISKLNQYKQTLYAWLYKKVLIRLQRLKSMKVLLYINRRYIVLYFLEYTLRFILINLVIVDVHVNNTLTYYDLFVILIIIIILFRSYLFILYYFFTENINSYKTWVDIYYKNNTLTTIVKPNIKLNAKQEDIEESLIEYKSFFISYNILDKLYLYFADCNKLIYIIYTLIFIYLLFLNNHIPWIDLLPIQYNIEPFSNCLINL